jgi:hypothetical protein
MPEPGGVALRPMTGAREGILERINHSAGLLLA